MPLYLARMEHPDGDRWGQYVVEHVLYLKELIAQGRFGLRPAQGTALRAGFLILKADSLQEAQALIEADPFTREDLICGLSIEQWDPVRHAGRIFQQAAPGRIGIVVRGTGFQRPRPGKRSCCMS